MAKYSTYPVLVGIKIDMMAKYSTYPVLVGIKRRPDSIYSQILFTEPHGSWDGEVGDPPLLNYSRVGITPGSGS